jgi:hypothetical protein
VGKAIENSRALGLALSRNVEVKVDWKELGEALFGVVANGFAACFVSAEGIGGGISALGQAAKSISAQETAGAKAWSLFLLSFAWALDDLTCREGIDREPLKHVLRDIIRLAREKVDTEAVVMPVTFLSRPTTIPLYQVLRDKMIEQKQLFRPSPGEDEMRLRARFDASFNRALFEIWSKREEAFQGLLAIFQAPGYEAASFELQWEAYRKRLIHDFESRPVFGQEETKISLSQLYVPLRAFHRYSDSDTAERAQEGPEGEPRGAVSLCLLETELLNWIRGATTNGARLIGGGPGSGKSTTLRSLARRLADMPEWRPLYIPLQHIDIDGDLRDAIGRFFADRTGDAFMKTPLSRASVEDGPPLVLLFDGLDELSRPGEAAEEVARLFVLKLNSLLTSLGGAGAKTIQVIATGRMPAFQAVRKYLGVRGEAALEVVGFLPFELAVREQDPLADVDQRLDWWRQYAQATGLPPDMPQSMTDPRLLGITDEPLLCYLLAISGFTGAGWEAAAENRNLIYERLIADVWQRGWGEGVGTIKRQGPGKTVSLADFQKLMETIALAAWLGGDTRVCSHPGFLEAVEVSGAASAWQEFQAANGPDVTNLALNFYLKSAEDSHRGFEFTHKSFGDYLAARAIIGIAFEITPLTEDHVSYALQRWVDALCVGDMTGDIVTFIRDEMRLAARSNPDAVLRLKTAFQRLAENMHAQGATPSQHKYKTWREGETLQANAEMSLWAVMNAAARAIAEYIKHESPIVKIQWGEATGLSDTIIRLTANGHTRLPFLSCLSHVFAENAEIYSLNLGSADFSDAKLAGANFDGAQLSGADFTGADLSGASFIWSDLSGTSFTGAIIEDARFARAHIGRSDVILASTGVPFVDKLTLVSADLEAKDYGKHSFLLSNRSSNIDLQMRIQIVNRLFQTRRDAKIRRKRGRSGPRPNSA